MATSEGSSATNDEENFESYDLDCVLSLLDDGFFDCDDELNEAAKKLDAEIADELDNVEKEVSFFYGLFINKKFTPIFLWLATVQICYN